jgi:hypothetical protein
MIMAIWKNYRSGLSAADRAKWSVPQRSLLPPEKRRDFEMTPNSFRGKKMGGREGRNVNADTNL